MRVAQPTPLRPSAVGCVAAALLLVSLPLAGCKKKEAEVEKPAVAVQVAHPSDGPISEDIVGDAILAPVAQAAIASRISAPIKQFYVQRGSRVSAGQLVARLESQDLAAAAVDNQGTYTAARGAFDTATQSAVPEEDTRARLDVAQARSTLDLDKSILDARTNLLNQGAIPGRDVDTARATVIQAQAAYDLAAQKYAALQKVGHGASIQSAQGQLESARGKYLGAEAQLSYTSLHSPIKGVVTDRPLFPGETAAAGTPVVTVMDTSSLIAKLHIAQAQAQQMVLGAAATITVPGLETPVPAKVSLISPALDSGSTTVEVWLKVDNAKGSLRSGTAVHATIKGHVVQHAMLIPTDAVQRSSEGAGKVVMVVGAGGVAHRKTVTLGIQTTETTQVLDGLTAGDTVIVSGGYGLDEGARIKVSAAGEKPEADAKPAAGEKE